MIVADVDRWKRLSPLVDELLDLAPQVRAERLAHLGAADGALAAELEALVADAERAERADFLAGSAGGTATVATLAGTRLGAYVLEAPLGQGGAGAVWRARRADGRFEGSVAVKLLHPSLIGRTGARRFEREGAILARLSHPNIARLLDAGVAEGGQPYLVLELVAGDRIDQHCDRRRLRVDERIALFRDVLEAVAHAHRHLVIHRDIKPSNILVTTDGNVKLLDFGIAKLLQGDRGGDDLTGGRGAALTPDYAAPEQLRGEAVTTATDVYSLGILLYQLLTGRHPTAPPQASAADLMRSTLETEPGPLSLAVTTGESTSPRDVARITSARDTSLGRLQRQLGGDLENIVAKALRKVPAERYATVDAFADDLRRWSAGEPVSARPDTVAYRTARFVTRHRGAVAAGALTIAAIVIGLVGTIIEARRAELHRQEAQVERDHALRDLAFADAARDLVGFLVSQSNATPLTAAELLGRAEQLAERQFADDPLSRGRLQLLLGIEYGNVQEDESSKAVLLRAREAARAASSPALLSNVDCMIAETLGEQNEPARAETLFGEAIARLKSEAEVDGSVLAGCLHMRADLNAHLGRPEAMLADAQAALAALGPPRPDQRVLANSIRIVVAEAHGRLGQTAEAVAAYERSIADLEAMGRAQSARNVVRYNNFSRMLYVAGQTSRAEQMAGRGLEISRGVGASNELDAILEGNRARALVDLGRYDEAKRLFEHALGSAEERKDLRWAGTFALYGAPAWCETGDAAGCARLLAVARERLKATLPPAHSNFGVIELVAAQLSLAEGRPAEARDELGHAVELFDAASDKTPLRIRALERLAAVEQHLADPAAALRHASLALDQAREVSKGFASTAWLGSALLTLGSVELEQGDRRAAGPTLRAALGQLQDTLGEDAPATRQARLLIASS
ncbi:MAG TPA: serine/threonine-protein kinase [Caldimonas sp.]